MIHPLSGVPVVVNGRRQSYFSKETSQGKVAYAQREQ